MQGGALGIWRGHGLSPFLESRFFGKFNSLANEPAWNPIEER